MQDQRGSCSYYIDDESDTFTEEENDNHEEEEEEEEDQEELGERQLRRVYLVTYSKADMDKYPSRRSFSDTVMSAFTKAGASVKHWACCLELHQNNEKHYHFIAAMDRMYRWNPIRAILRKDNNLNVNFSGKTLGYVAAYRYVTKSDKEVLHSDNHPDLELINSPVTKLCMTQNKVNAKRRRLSMTTSSASGSSSSNSKGKKKIIPPTRLTYPDVAQFVLKRGIKSLEVLKAVAMTRKDEGEGDLFAFLAKNNDKNVGDLINRAWSMKHAASDLREKAKSRSEKLEEAGKRKCNCSGQWARMATQIMSWNGINLQTFCDAVLELLNLGRGKNRNLYLCGPANCGKSFLLEPLEQIYRCFTTPASNKYAWTGVDDAEILFLNDFRWKVQGPIEWSEFLNLLEGAPVKLNQPKNHFATDLIISRENTIPIFATGIREIEYIGAYQQRDREEDNMMAERWVLFKFTHRIPRSDAVKIPSCSRCFYNFLMLGAYC